VGPGGRLGNFADRGGSGGGTDLGWGGWWDGRPLSPEDIRQLSGEARQWYNEAQQLRRDLRGLDNVDFAELDRVLAELRQLQDPRVYQNVEELVRRQAAVTEQLKRFEYGVRRQVSDERAVALSGADEIPDEHKPLVEEYFRSLARPRR
jgi:hypothetical protein